MALFNAFDRGKFLSELNSPYDDGSGTVMTPAQQRAAVIDAVFGGVSDPGIDSDVVLQAGNSLTSPSFLTATNVGTAEAGITAEEHGDGLHHYTKLTLTNFTIGTGGDAEDLTIGALVYTFPAGTIGVFNGSVVGVFDQTSHGTITSGEVALGTVQGSGAANTVSSTEEDILEGGVGAISTYVLGTTVVQTVDQNASPLIVLSAGVHTVYLNIAASWPNIAAGETVKFTGVITLEWRKLS